MKTIIYTIILAIFLFPLDIRNNEVFAHEVKEPILPEPKIQVYENLRILMDTGSFYAEMTFNTQCMGVEIGMKFVEQQGWEIYDYSINNNDKRQMITWFHKHTLNSLITVSSDYVFPDGVEKRIFCVHFTGNLSEKQYKWNKERYKQLRTQ